MESIKNLPRVNFFEYIHLYIENSTQDTSCKLLCCLFYYEKGTSFKLEYLLFMTLNNTKLNFIFKAMLLKKMHMGFTKHTQAAFPFVQFLFRRILPLIQGSVSIHIHTALENPHVISKVLLLFERISTGKLNLIKHFKVFFIFILVLVHNSISK